MSSEREHHLWFPFPQGSLQNAVQYFQRALQLNVCDPCALHHIADQYRRLGHHEAEKEALELLNKVR